MSTVELKLNIST